MKTPTTTVYKWGEIIVLITGFRCTFLTKMIFSLMISNVIWCSAFLSVIYASFPKVYIRTWSTVLGIGKRNHFSIVTFLVAVLRILPTDLKEEKDIRCYSTVKDDLLNLFKVWATDWLVPRTSCKAYWKD